jgi:hypothetical protein
MNFVIEKHNSSEKGNKICLFSEAEFLGLGLLIGAFKHGSK